MHLEYRVFQAQGLGNLQMPGQVAMAGYHFSINAERLGLDPKTVKILISWPEGKTDECRFLIDAPIAEEILRLAFHNALRSVGLGAEQS